MSNSTTLSCIIESVYFHWGNGGLSFKVVEHLHKWTPTPLREAGFPEQPPKSSWHYTMEVSASHHGGEMKTTFDLGSMEIVGWLHEMTGRLLKRMEKKPEQARHHVFDYHPQGKVSVADGEHKEYHFRFRDGKVTPVVMERKEFSGDGFSGVAVVEEGSDAGGRVEKFFSKLDGES